jgi:hypothetical protein
MTNLADLIPAANSSQTSWAWCQKCQGLFYGPYESRSVCPAGGTHDYTESGIYVLRMTTGGSPE